MASAPLIFVVDDTDAARRATVLVLEKAGFRVAEAADGTSALRSISELNPDLVLLDAVLPDIGGIEVLRRLRAEPRFALLPVVILSSQLTQAKDQAEGLEAGADGYIARPIGNVELVARVRALLRNVELSRQLRESEARFRELITQQADGLLVVDADGCIQFANPAAARIFGRRREDLVGHPFGFPISSGAVVQIDVPGAAALGRILEFNASATRWDDQPAHLISLRDVTEQRLAERNLRESEKRLSGIFQQSAAGLFLASLDGRYLRVNQRFCEILGCTEAEILARNSTETTHLDDRPLEASMTATMLAGGLSSPSWDKRYLRRDGSPIWTNLTLSLLRDEEGDPQQYVGVVIDITERKAADELVRTRARQQEAVARIGFEATRTTTLQGIFDFATGAVAEALGVELCKVLQLAPDGSHLRLVSGVGWQAGLIGVGTVGVDRESQAGFTLNADGAIYVNDFARETRFTAPPLLRDHEVVSGLSVKILLRGKPWGVLGAHCRTVRTFNDVDADFMQAVATLLAVVIERLAVQRTLTESEARMREAQRIAHLGNWELDITENKLSWSEEVFRIFGVDSSTFAATYESFMAFVHPDDRAALQAAQQAVLSGRGRLNFEHRILRPDGSIRHVRERGELIHDANGRPVALSGTVLDTTELRAAQSQAERMNALLTDAQRIADMGSWEMDLTSGRLVWSEETCRLFGIRPEEFGGTFESFTGFILPEDMAAYNAVHAGITPEAPLLESEYRIRRPDGEVRWMFERGRVTFDADGKVIRRLGVVMDITGRKRAEEQLQSGSKRLTLATQAGGVGIWDYEVACNRLIWDAQMYRLYGIEPEQFSGAYEAWTAGVHPEDRRRGDEEIQQALRGEKNFDTEFRVLWPDGSTRHIRALAIVERDAAGRAVRMVGTNWDITERKRAEAELREREQLLRIAGRIARVGAWSVDFPEVRITWSDEVCAIHDMPAGTVPALDRALDYYTPESRPVIESAFSLCAHEGTPFDVEIELQSAKGQRRWVRSIGQAERDQTGAIRRVSGAFQDITDQKLAQKKQMQDGSLRRIAGAIAKIGGWSLSVPDYHLDWSEEIFDIVEYPRGPVPSLEKALELYPEPWQSQLGAAITACATGGTPIDMELMIRSAKGRLFWARCKAEAVRDSAGRITQVQGAFQDISAQKAADAKAAELGNRLINTLESITDAFFTVDSDWRFTYLNGEAETLLERKRAELLGQNVWEKFPEAVGSEFYQAYHRARETQQTVSFESFYPPLNKWFEVRAHPSEEGLAVYFSDVTERRRTVDALRASESKFRQLSESNILGLLFWTSQGGITDANDAFLRMVGYTREELTTGQIDWRNMTPPEYLAQDERVLAELAAGGNCPPFEKEYFHKDGHRVAIVLGATTLDGAKDQGICYVVDISAQKQAKEQLLRNQALLRMAGRAARLGGWSLHLASGKLTWSEETCRIHDEPPGFQPVLETAISYYVPAHRGMVTERVGACLETGQPFDFEAEIVTAKGHRLWVRAVGEAVRNAGGVITGMEGAFQDITPLKLAEQSVEESQRRFRQLAESMPYIVWTARPDGMVDYANAVFSDYTGVPQEEPPETYWQACVHPEDLAACIREWQHCVREEILYSIEFRVRRGHDGAYRWFRVQATPIRDAGGRLIKWYGTGLDVDETKRLQQEATGLADRLTTTFESLTDGFIALDTQWRFSYVNDRAIELMQRSREEVIGNVVWELFPEAVGSTFEQQYRQAVATGISVTFEEYFPPLATWFEVRAFPSSEGL